MLKFISFMPVLFFLASSCHFPGSRVGLHDDFSAPEKWYEVLPSHDTVAPTVQIEWKNQAMVIRHRQRSLEEAYKWCPWIKWKRDFSTNLRRNYGVVDLDRFHYVVLNIRLKGSSSYFDINGFTTKLGYTTGITVIDLRDYDDPKIRGKQKVDFGIDLQDNHTFLVLDDLKFVSKLSKTEKKRLIGGGLTIRNENLKARPYHGLKAIKARAGIPLPHPDGEEMAIFRDDATGAITTRLTDAPGDDNFGEGGIWSADGAAIKFESPRKIGGIPICIPGEGKVIAGPVRAGWNIWSPADPDLLYFMKREGMKFTVSSWNRVTRVEKIIAGFTVPEVGSYVEFKNFTDLGNLIVGFRETPNLYIVNVKNHTVRYVHLPVRLKDATVGRHEKIVTYANCYTFELRTYNTDTKQEGRAPSFSAGHASWGPNGMVANFGGHLNVFVPDNIGVDFAPGSRITVWANWKNDIVTDYGSLTSDNKYVFTNGRKADVDSQHLMIPSSDPGAVMRVARYFTKFSWTSTTYSRPSPDYTKLIYNENMMGNTELHMVYTRRPNAPVGVSLKGDRLTWTMKEPDREIASYNIYASDQSGRGFVKINEKPVVGREYTVSNNMKYYAVAAVEHSGLESSFSREVSKDGTRSFYFEAEEMQLTPPARRFFDGYCNNFQCVRINAESRQEKAQEGVITLPVENMPAAVYSVWGRVKGYGCWSMGNTMTTVRAKEWQWVKLGTYKAGSSNSVLNIRSGDDALKLDLILLTTGSYVPKASYPPDGNAPPKVQGLQAKASGNQVFLSWDPSVAPDLHHYSVYCGSFPGFICNNETLIRSVLKTSLTDALPSSPKGLYYKVVAVDNRWNGSEPAEIQINGR